MAGKLILCGTPIGNLEDMSLRSVRTLREAEVIACEDTRRTRKLLAHHGIPAPRLVVYNDANERRQAAGLVATIESGRSVVLVSDAGMPGLSDPGYRLVSACVEAGIEIDVVPGPSAVVTAVAVSGLAPGRFVFEGFLPRKASERRRRIGELAFEERTVVLYESPHRIQAALDDLAAGLGGRRAALARELTKLYEEVRRGPLPELADGVRADPPRGEIVIVIEGAPRVPGQIAPRQLARRARMVMAEGIERSEALSRVAKEAGVPRRAVFDALVDHPEDGGS
ncbi:MAG: 16S rRNA (cytidine(1402)-2'-O)-methyltransferase [Actinomycetota bacterium]